MENNNYPSFVIDDIFTTINGAKSLRGVMMDCMHKAWPGKKNIAKRWAFAKNYEASAKDFLRDTKLPKEMRQVMEDHPGVAESQCRFQLGNLNCHVNRPTYKDNWNYDKCLVAIEADEELAHIQKLFDPLSAGVKMLTGKPITYPQLEALRDQAKKLYDYLKNLASKARKQGREDGTAVEQTPYDELPIDIVIEGFVGEKNKHYEMEDDVA